MNKTQLVKHLLLNSDISLNDIATKVGVNRSNLYLWKNGKTKPTISNINNLANIFNVKLKWYKEDKVEIIENNTIDDQKLDYIPKAQEKIISLQSEKITNLEKTIKRLEKKLSHGSKNLQNNRTFNLYTSIKFKNKINADNPTENFQQSSKRTVEGNFKSLGYSKRELEKMPAQDFLKLYHPDSIKDGIKTMKILAENSNSIMSLEGIRMLKSKTGNWIVFNCKMYWERDPKNPLTWLLNAYYTELTTKK